MVREGAPGADGRRRRLSSVLLNGHLGPSQTQGRDSGAVRAGMGSGGGAVPTPPCTTLGETTSSVPRAAGGPALTTDPHASHAPGLLGRPRLATLLHGGRNGLRPHCPLRPRGSARAEAHMPQDVTAKKSRGGQAPTVPGLGVQVTQGLASLQIRGRAVENVPETAAGQTPKDPLSEGGRGGGAGVTNKVGMPVGHARRRLDDSPTRRAMCVRHAGSCANSVRPCQSRIKM